MAQYTFSYVRSEYDRIPIQLKAELDQLLAESEVDDKTRALMAAVCASVEKAVGDLAHYAQDQLRVW